MAVKNSWKCRGFAVFVKEALEHRSPCQATLLAVQWKMIQISSLDCQVGTREMSCMWEPQGSVKICRIWYLPNARSYPPLTDELASQAGSANTCRATPSSWRHWASHCLIITCGFEREASYVSGRCPTADEAAPCILFLFFPPLFTWTSNLNLHVAIPQRMSKKGRRYRKLSSGWL